MVDVQVIYAVSIINRVGSLEADPGITFVTHDGLPSTQTVGGKLTPCNGSTIYIEQQRSAYISFHVAFRASVFSPPSIGLVQSKPRLCEGSLFHESSSSRRALPQSNDS